MRASSRNAVFAIGVGVFVLVSIALYNSIDSRYHERKAHYLHGAGELRKLESKLKRLELEIRDNNRVMSTMGEKLRAEREKLRLLDKLKSGEANGVIENVRANAKEHEGVLLMPKKEEQIAKEEQNAEKAAEFAKEQEQAEKGVLWPPGAINNEKGVGGKVAVVRNFLNSVKGGVAQVGDDVCAVRATMSRADSQIQMLDVYELLPFDDPDGGVWKQGYDITYDAAEVQREKKLEVVVTPHSHTDPGWLKTFEDYYSDQTKSILDHMLSYLQLLDDMRFIYAEICFFERWWAEIDERKREVVKRLLRSGHLEILSGAWVMTDEANAHYFATIAEMIEGHEWIRNHIGEDYKPTNHWSIDPFGLSPTVSYLMARANITNAIVQRVHYAVKKHLAKNMQLEFRWRQLFGGQLTSSDLVTHVMPFFSYDVPHTCGPDPKICCQFDFRRLPGDGMSCPWNVPPVLITENNIEERAALLYDQYRKKAQLFKTNVLFVPLGDDFRYDLALEWEQQHANYVKLFKYMNSKDEWNVHARFGTPEEYFTLMKERLSEESSADEGQLPVLSGDFFTYADRNDHYWSGYYTSRPFYKHMDRVLQHYLRSAEILFSLVKARDTGSFKTGDMFGALVEARRHLSLFQHHDGITGTARDAVVADYGRKMLSALVNCEHLICAMSELLLRKNSNDDTSSNSYMSLDETWSAHDSLPVKIAAFDGNEVLLFNSLTQERTDVVCLHVKSLKNVIRRASAPSDEVQQQMNPVFNVSDGKPVPNNNFFELCFVATVPALGFVKYVLSSSPSGPQKASLKAVYPISSKDFKSIRLAGEYFTLEGDLLSAKFSTSTGLLKSVKPKDSDEIVVNVSFVKYGARGKSPEKFNGGDDLSGAYLFLPDGPAKALDSQNYFVVVEGPVMKKVFVIGERAVRLEHSATLTTLSPFVQLENVVDLNGLSNYEFAMRFKTGILSGEHWHTDLNGFQMVRRRRFAKLPLQAQFYPMRSAFLEDDTHRFTLLGAQPLGAASLESGWLEVMLDRRLNQDDGRGLFAGVTDNKKTRSIFRIALEPLRLDTAKLQKPTMGFHSLATMHMWMNFQYPLMVLLANEDEGRSNSFTALGDSFPCDVHLVTLRTASAPTVYGEQSSRSHSARDEQALILQRVGVDCRSTLTLPVNCTTTAGKVTLGSIFKHRAKSIVETSLTMLYDKPGEVDEITLNPMDVRTFRVKLS